jgi:predicted transcriptional regulator
MKDAVLTVRLPRRTRGRIEQAARREGRSLSQQVERLVEAGLAAGDEGRLRPPTRLLADVLQGGIVPGLEVFRAARRELSGSLDTRSRRMP